MLAPYDINEPPFHEISYIEIFDDLDIQTDTASNNIIKNICDMWLHFIHLNINSLLKNLDEISKQTLIGITESKIDE